MHNFSVNDPGGLAELLQDSFFLMHDSDALSAKLERL
jgi:hypothetical protein